METGKQIDIFVRSGYVAYFNIPTESFHDGIFVGQCQSRLMATDAANPFASQRLILPLVCSATPTWPPTSTRPACTSLRNRKRVFPPLADRLAFNSFCLWMLSWLRVLSSPYFYA